MRHRADRKPCNEVLWKEVKLQDGKLKLYPKKVYCYNSIIETLKLFLQHPGFTSRCELWRTRERTSIGNLLSDVIHGTVWRDFKGPDGSHFMSHQRNVALMMNVDWFQPFKHSPYSVGVIYLALMNLPRGERYKRENIIVVGIIPGPGEPSVTNVRACEPEPRAYFCEPLLFSLFIYLFFIFCFWRFQFNVNVFLSKWCTTRKKHKFSIFFRA